MDWSDGVGTRKLFFLTQIGIGVAFLFILLRMRFSGHKSGFKERESRRDRSSPFKKTTTKPGQIAPDPLAEAKMEESSRKSKKHSPLLLEGLSILDREPHEILNVAKEASTAEIQSAFRELMKRFHPDRVGPQGSREWQDAQKLSQAIIEAKETLMKRAKKKSES